MDDLIKIRDQLLHKKNSLNFGFDISSSNIQNSISLQNEINKTNKMITDLKFGVPTGTYGGAPKVLGTLRKNKTIIIALAVAVLCIALFFISRPKKTSPQDEE